MNRGGLGNTKPRHLSKSVKKGGRRRRPPLYSESPLQPGTLRVRDRVRVRGIQLAGHIREYVVEIIACVGETLNIQLAVGQLSPPAARRIVAAFAQHRQRRGRAGLSASSRQSIRSTAAPRNAQKYAKSSSQLTLPLSCASQRSFSTCRSSSPCNASACPRAGTNRFQTARHSAKYRCS